MVGARTWEELGAQVICFASLRGQEGFIANEMTLSSYVWKDRGKASNRCSLNFFFSFDLLKENVKSYIQLIIFMFTSKIFHHKFKYL